MEQKDELSSYIQSISLFLLGVLFMAFPVIFTTISSNPLILPKQVLLGGVVLILIVFQVVKMFAQKSIKLRRTPFDIPILLIAIITFLSSILAVNKADALISFFPYLFAIFGFFLIVNLTKDKNSLLFLMASLVIGSVLLSVNAILSFFKIYILPFPGTNAQTFTPLGSLLEQEIYLVLVFAIAGYYLYRLLKFRAGKETVSASANVAKTNITKQELTKVITFGAACLVILMGIIVTTYAMFKYDKPLILPIETGFQTALSEISLDSGRVAQGFLFGSGFGTYVTDFTRFKQASFNQYQDIWNLTFFRSSSFVLELLATTGVLGLCAFIFLLGRILREIKSSPQNKMLISIIIMSIVPIILPLNFISQTLFFIILGLFAVNQGLIGKAQNRFFDIELQIVTLKKGLIAMEVPHARSGKSLVLPSIAGAVILVIVGIIGFYAIPYIASDITFQKSLVAAAQNKGSLTYQLQGQAISTFPYRDGFYRIFSQTNLALANTLASQQTDGTAPSQETQQNISTLIQQSINAARAAVTVAPQSYLNWQNLSTIYRGLIGFGENAESFAIATAQQSINLDQNNPQEYITLGGIYYQLGQWDNAQNQFQLAVVLKPDYANSHYNLGHTLEQKGDLQNALAQYQAVKSLVASDKASLEQINKEIDAVLGKAQAGEATTASNQPLQIDKPQAQLPAQNPPVQIPAPNVATQSSR